MEGRDLVTGENVGVSVNLCVVTGENVGVSVSVNLCVVSA